MLSFLGWTLLLYLLDTLQDYYINYYLIHKVNMLSFLGWTLLPYNIDHIQDNYMSY